jgi:hypothetical protein
VLNVPNHQMVDVNVSYNASDNSGGATCSLSVASNDPVNGLGDGDTAPDWLVVDDHHVQVRSEHGRARMGRVYTITVTCADAAGNSTSRNTTVSVPRGK